MAKNKAVKKAKEPPSGKNKDFVIIGIGASAGGLEALQELLSNLPELDNVAFIIAQHVSPTHKSMMVGLLRKYTDLEVDEAKNGTTIKPSVVYICPPNKNIFIEDGSIVLKEPAADTILPKPSVDLFFTSLAKHSGDHSIGIILSGTGTDGRLGTSAIKNAGGITMVQEPRSAKYDGMPLASIQGAAVDIIATTSEIGEELKDIVGWIRGETDVKPSQAPQSDLMIILGILKQYSGVDFTSYKTTTINRRIQRRMQALHTTESNKYIEYLQQNTEEVKLLYKDLLIGVTSFFRNPESFDRLKEALEARLEESTKEPASFRAWTVGCSTGEEAYSIAILLFELFHSKATAISIFATDVDPESIQFARTGSYSAEAVKAIPDALRTKYFERDGVDRYRVIKPIRDAIVFSAHDLTRDPPFSKMDLVSCRNLLIYFNQDLQRQALRSITFSLKIDGILFLGASETITEFEDAYTNVARENKIFKKAFSPDLKDRSGFITLATSKPPVLTPEKTEVESKSSELAMHDMLLATVGEYFLPMSVVINENMTVVYSRQKNPYLSLAPGASNLQITKMVPSELELDLRTAIHEAAKSETPQSTRFIEVTVLDSHTRFVRVVVLPIAMRRQASRLMIVSFQEEKPELLEMTRKIVPSEEDLSSLRHLEIELKQTKSQLQSVIEELETSNEELQATNEELQSTNEELQSTNEELETANEELQSSNEEVQVAYNQLQLVSDENQVQRKVAEDASEALEVERTLLKGISDSSPSGIMAFKAIRDKDYEIVDFEWTFSNSRGSEIIGRRTEDIIGKRLLEEMPGNREEGLFDIYRDVTNGRKEIDREFFYMHEGLKHWFHQNVVPFLDGFVVTFTDITDTKQQKLEAAIHEARLRIATDATGIGIWEWDLAEDRMVMSDIMRRQFGIPARDFHGKISQWKSRVHPGDIADLEAGLDKTASGGGDLQLSYRSDFDGETRYFDVHASLVDDDEDRPRLIGTNIDITEQREQQKTLIELRDQALEGSRAKTQFMANMSHEMRTPLHGIMGSATLLDTDPLNEKQKHYLDNIVKSSGNLTRIIDDVLDLSKIEADQLMLEDIDFLLSDVLQDVLDGIDVLARKKNIEISTEMAPGIPRHLVGDSFRLAQVLMNLVSNAVKFTDDGGEIRVSVREGSRVMDGIELLFSVRDNGIGIAEENVETLFRPFNQVEASMSRRFGGTGLGLAIARQLVGMMHGEIWVESKQGEGSEFFFTATFHASSLNEEALKARSDDAEGSEPEMDVDGILRGKRVLLAEDDAINATIAMELLASKAVEVVHVEDGHQVMDALANEGRFDLVLMDCHMPNMDGYEATMAIRKEKKYRNLPIVALTASALDEDRQKASDAGMDDHFAKPFKPEGLYGLIARLVSR